MADIWDKYKRSAVMSLIRSHGNKATELRLIEVFRKHQITGWRRGQRLIGNPDFVFRKERLCVFVDGCFWHGCPKHGSQPKQNQEYWKAKIQRNRDRDRKVIRQLGRFGWRSLRVWEHELALKKEPRLVARLRKYLCSSIKRNDE